MNNKEKKGMMMPKTQLPIHDTLIWQFGLGSVLT